ncbi:MFS general substrate transporter [Panus rudis PR-1116 ss-1]|nr:MFS general substrate transporter [Panus rudis PR-1116 ss-1]
MSVQTPSSQPQSPEQPRPWGLKWRSSVWFVTLVVALGIATDLLVYSMVVPVMPFQLESLHYDNVSSLVGWLLFAFTATPPIAALSEHYSARYWPLLSGQIFLIGSQIMMMEAPSYWLMVIARIIQGISSTIISVVGLALLCDTVPEEIVGKQLGFTMTGFSIGEVHRSLSFLVGPPVGGALYNSFGFRGPFVFGISITLVDLIGRLLVIERKDALKYGYDPGRPSKKPQENIESMTEKGNTEQLPADNQQQPAQNDTEVAERASTLAPPRISHNKVVLILLRSPRALTVMFSSLVYAVCYTISEPTLPLHLENVWNLSSSTVGIVYIALVMPMLVSSPLTGWLSDRIGTEWITALTFLLSVPWWGVLIIEKSLALFIVALAFQSFFLSGSLSPITAELAAVSRHYEGVGYAHVYGAFNLSYGVGSALGPIIGGQIYDNISKGWLAICLIVIGLVVLCSFLCGCFTGTKPLLRRILERRSRSQLNTTVTQQTEESVTPTMTPAATI